MSFPPRPPMGMPPMGPGGMMPPGYPYPPMGMMPVGMRMMPQMMRPGNPIPPNNINNRASKKLVPQEIPKSDDGDDKPPVTTVFVGNISERAPDAMIRQMLQRCGNVVSWKRVQGASGKLQAFGFCAYEDPEATLRCIRLLNEWRIADKRLVVKVDAKTKSLLDDYKRKKRQKMGTSKKKDEKEEAKEDSEKEQGEIDDEDRPSDDEDDDDDELDEFCQREDRVATAGLDAIMREYTEDLSKEPPAEMSIEEKREKRREKKEKEKSDKDPGLDDMELEEEKLDLINREIKSFRDAHKEDDQGERDKARERERDVRRRREEEWERDRERERERERERDREREMRREKDRDRERREREVYHRRSRSRSRDHGRSISRDRSVQKDRDRDRGTEDEEEAYERRKLERKIREKEASYQEMLKKWEARERKKNREYEKEKDREDDRKAEESREARRLKEFLEDYDDERDDPKYYKGSALQRRLKEREKEMEADERDRQREKEELEEIRRKLEDEGHPDIEAEMARIEKERDEHLMPRLQLSPEESDMEVDEDKENHELSPEVEEAPPEPVYQEKPPPAKIQPKMKPLEPANSLSSSRSPSRSDDDDDDDDNEGGIIIPESGPVSEDSLSQNYSQLSASLPGLPSREDQQAAKIGFGGLKLGAGASESPEPQKRKKLSVVEVFNQDEEDETPMKKHRLIPLVYSEEEKAALISPSKPTTAEEKRKCIKNLIEKIPTGKEELFAFVLDWNMVDQMLMDRRIKPWVNKKIVEYIGEEEPTLTEFICQKVMAHSSPAHILNDVAMVLDEEAEVFVVKMWRLLIYETEAKKLGLVK